MGSQNTGGDQMSPFSQKGNEEGMGSYRSVRHPHWIRSSDYSILSSIFFFEHLHRNATVNRNQHGFVKDKSCQTNLASFFVICLAAQRNSVDQCFSTSAIAKCVNFNFQNLPASVEKRWYRHIAYRKGIGYLIQNYYIWKRYRCACQL